MMIGGKVVDLMRKILQSAKKGIGGCFIVLGYPFHLLYTFIHWIVLHESYYFVGLFSGAVVIFNYFLRAYIKGMSFGMYIDALTDFWRTVGYICLLILSVTIISEGFRVVSEFLEFVMLPGHRLYTKGQNYWYGVHSPKEASSKIGTGGQVSGEQTFYTIPMTKQDIENAAIVRIK